MHKLQFYCSDDLLLVFDYFGSMANVQLTQFTRERFKELFCTKTAKQFGLCIVLVQRISHILVPIEEIFHNFGVEG